jgi:hypothetical protein
MDQECFGEAQGRASNTWVAIFDLHWHYEHASRSILLSKHESAQAFLGSTKTWVGEVLRTKKICRSLGFASFGLGGGALLKLDYSMCKGYQSIR